MPKEGSACELRNKMHPSNIQCLPKITWISGPSSSANAFNLTEKIGVWSLIWDLLGIISAALDFCTNFVYLGYLGRILYLRQLSQANANAFIILFRPSSGSGI